MPQVPVWTSWTCFCLQVSPCTNSPKSLMENLHPSCSPIRSELTSYTSTNLEIPDHLSQQGLKRHTETEQKISCSCALLPPWWAAHWGQDPSGNSVPFLQHLDQQRYYHLQNCAISVRNGWWKVIDLVCTLKNIMHEIRSPGPTAADEWGRSLD